MNEHMEVIVVSLQTMASIAYWRERQHCGSDFDGGNCTECEHYDMCFAEDTLKFAIRRLKESER